MRDWYWDEEQHRLRRTPAWRTRMIVRAALGLVTVVAMAFAAGAIAGASSLTVALLIGGAALVYGSIYAAVYREVLDQPPTSPELRDLLRETLRPPPA